MDDYVTALIYRYENNKISHADAPAGFYFRCVDELAFIDSISPYILFV